MAAEPGPSSRINAAPAKTFESIQSGEEDDDNDNGRRGKVPIGRPWLGCCPIAQAMNPSEAMGGPFVDSDSWCWRHTIVVLRKSMKRMESRRR
ncbi:hypothetical protein LTR47_003435 [Exophiala xenobiotica]|nr:hypothetical protein LTR47_003435 [Exophiala xenobiotica]KAK5249589.1 hypothetical protein LTS06_005513 [Exophiala xenobiotica]KAK5354240.1 hypothetical protein LTR61_002936 [Exophiala xenobiotica]KAK5358896.1 hypothetical protein LTR11_010775 [Exophiala xenobiotica]KAK5371952.1 hypothetical protein LTS03_007050 [Exophiala xenobiotica]